MLIVVVLIHDDNISRASFLVPLREEWRAKNRVFLGFSLLCDPLIPILVEIIFYYVQKFYVQKFYIQKLY